jgi:hypothetical protein
MHDQLSLIVADRTENHARILLAAREGADIVAIAGTVRGPYSDFAKTLTADFAFKPTATAGTAESLIVEPCYWTPHMPFWYDLRLQLRMSDGTQREEILRAGIRRLYCEGRNLRLESKRIVLRGLRYNSPTENDLKLARECETALLVSNPTTELCLAASRLGVPLVVDLSGRESIDQEILHELDWSPAVMLVLMDLKQLSRRAIESARPRQCFVAAFADGEMQEPDVKCDAFAVQLASGEHPPAWMATCKKPVIAIRKDAESKIITARAGCDRLQAELAPEFDLAGYFV